MRLDKLIQDHLQLTTTTTTTTDSTDSTVEEIKPKPHRKQTTSLKQAQALVRGGEVSVDGAVLRNPKCQVVPFLQTVTCRAAPVVTPQARHGFFKMHKPRGYICQRHPSEPSVYNLIPSSLVDRFGDALVCWGRLDRDTTGCLVFGTDGGLSAMVLRPASVHAGGGKWKEYVARLVEPTANLHSNAVELFRGGLEIVGAAETGSVARCAPGAVLEIVDDANVRIKIQEGFFHQVKRMVRAVGGEVKDLHREKFGNIGCDDVALGAMKELNTDELEGLFSAVKNEMAAIHSEGWTRLWKAREGGANANKADAEGASKLTPTKRQKVDPKPASYKSQPAALQGANSPS
jgi:16S rRNA pseudouridine516 synthase